MKIDKAETSEEFWIALIEDGMQKGYGSVLAPMAGLDRPAAIKLAVRLKVSLAIRDLNYVFNREKDGTLVQLGERVELH